MAKQAYINSAGRSLFVSGATTKGFLGTAKGTTVGTSGNDGLRTGGSTTLAGEDGDDTYYIYTNKDFVIEKASKGIDTVVSTADHYVLPDNVENLTVLGHSGTGNKLDNIIKAAGTGRQTLNGGGGNDVIIAGAGKDTILVAKGSGSDVIYSFDVRQDIVQLNDYADLNSFAKLKSQMSQVGADVVIKLGSETLTLRDVSVSSLKAENFSLPVDMSKFAQTFGDEFNAFNWYNSLTPTATPTGVWRTEFGFGGVGSQTSRTMNGGEQVYLDAAWDAVGLNPFSVDNGVLTITAKKTPEQYKPMLWNENYVSGVMTTKMSFAQQYGYFEIRAELPAGQGYWPAFWLMPTDNSWPPELDVFEVLGKDPNTIYATAHSAQTGKRVEAQSIITSVDTSKGFHTYGVNWQADKITWYIDGNQVAQTATPADMHKPMYMIANLAMGGSWGGATDATTPAVGRMNIDYIRAYAAKSGSADAPLVTPAPDAVPAPAPKPVVPVAPAAPVVPATLKVADLGAGSAAGGAKLVLTGTAAANTTVTVYSNQNEIGSGKVDASTGQFALTLNNLNAGSHEVTIRTGDGAVSNAVTVAVGTAGQIVGQLGTLAAKTNLGGIYLTDSRELPVDSVATINSLLASSKAALAAIKGGYSFTITRQSGTSTYDADYDANGAFVSSASSTFASGLIASKVVTYADRSTETFSYTNGKLVREVETHADGTKDIYLSNVTGQAYVSAHEKYAADNTLLSIERSAANGASTYKYEFDTDSGSKTTEIFAPNGTLSNRSISSNDGTLTQQKYVNDVIQSEHKTYAAGSPIVADLKTFTNGILTQETFRNADASSDTFLYNVTGRAYTQQHTAFDTSGKVKFIDQTLKDGSHLQTGYQLDQMFVSTEKVADTFKSLGSDTFTFHGDFGKDVIQGFHFGNPATRDVIHIDRDLASDFNQLSITAVGADTVITFDAHDSITLKQVSPVQLTHDYFMFV
ncbi:UNVERIFIED_ORG: beta-glucanase (GH16 family) [Methylobacterium sp. SuP10 SLI 274]|uniref:family 16 glycosylhydrolase n=1 Tax=Methylorubrum extorquens TaxID=408 RepID=UPI001AEA56F7|nr:family 16 glycosylhydrolase [Methylorubrum extorquens]MCP1561108.1 beta-glucanase (GH16 family) [Methylorubrum extorquens]MDF9861305.1 beta-glucanase (GH16 family) [Methylorubrum pseudosasae]MDH6634932.1 beta-glucanase (GH16 family) [Methylobacterium sp. SuP10 SLI 274]MDH6664102.1 beta-glucanase (GH16 family) [Methylorubrum zatmanii]